MEMVVTFGPDRVQGCTSIAMRPADETTSHDGPWGNIPKLKSNARHSWFVLGAVEILYLHWVLSSGGHAVFGFVLLRR